MFPFPKEIPWNRDEGGVDLPAVVSPVTAILARTGKAGGLVAVGGDDADLAVLGELVVPVFARIPDDVFIAGGDTGVYVARYGTASHRVGEAVVGTEPDFDEGRLVAVHG